MPHNKLSERTVIRRCMRGAPPLNCGFRLHERTHHMSAKDTAGRDYSAMTVNERLFTAGLLDEWYAAVRRRDRASMISMLMRVGLPETDAAWSVDTVLANPSRYGF